MNAEPEFEPQVPVLALDAIASIRRLGQETLVRELLQMYFDLTPKRIETIRQSLSQPHWSELKRAAHSLKSGSAMVGAMRVSSLAEQIECYPEDNDLKGLLKLVVSIEGAYREYLKRIEDLGLLP